MANNIIVGDKDCHRITDVLKDHDTFYTKWRDVFRKLNVPFKTLEPRRIALLHQTTTPESVYYESLQVWRSRESTRATLGTLISALVECHLTAIADELQEEFNVEPEDTANVIIGSKESRIISKEFLKDDEGFESRWKDIFRNLNVSTDVIDQVTTEFEEKDSKTKIEDVYNACLESWITTEGDNATAGRLISILHRFQLSELADELQEEFYVSHDNFQKPEEPLSISATWASLYREKKKIFIGRNVTFQRRVTNMKTIFEELELSKKSLDTFMGKYLDEKLLADLHYDRNPVIVRDTLPVKIKYYIERFLLSRRGIAEDVFRNSSDMFLVSGVERHVLSKLAGKELTDTARQQAEHNSLTVQHILLELKSDFDEICKITGKPIHWLQQKKGVYNWKRSRGNMKVIQSNVASEQGKIQEHEFLQHLEDGSKAPICISDSPGMGKSVVLANLGRTLLAEHPERLVIFVVLSTYISKVKDVEDNLESMVDILLNTFCTTPFESNLCRIYFKLQHLKVEILFDGLDEVNSADFELALKCVKMLDSLPAVRVWVTTRPHIRNNLENTVQQLAFNIQGFNTDNQINFLVRYWTTVSESEGVVLDKTRIEIFAKASLGALLEKKRDADKWAGVPLQCLLIAEVFRMHAVNFSEKNAGANTLPHISISNLKELFDRLVQKKIDLFAIRYPEEATQEVISELENSHIVFAFQALLPDIRFEELKMKPPLPIDILLKVGLMEAAVAGQPPHFIHLTFAEYFAAKFIHQVIQQGVQFPVYMNIFLETMKYTENETVFKKSNIVPMSFKFSVVLYFLNCFVDPNISLFPASLCSSSNRMSSLLKAAICGNHLSLFRCFLKHPSARLEINSEHLFLAVGFGDENLIEEVILLMKQDISSITCNGKEPGLGKEYKLSLLHVTAARGDYKVFEYLLKNQGCAEYLNSSKASSNGLIHHCVQNTRNEEDHVINNKVQILASIFPLNRLILEEFWFINQHDRTKGPPLLCSNVHVDLLRAMIFNGANARAQKEFGETVLHRAAYYLSREEYDQLIHDIPVPTFKRLVNLLGGYDYYKRLVPMYAMIKSFEPLQSSLAYFIEHGSDIKKCFDGYTCVGWAVCCNRTVECVETILSSGASGRNIDECGGNLLHVAAEVNNMKVIEKFCEEYDINSKDNNDTTPLHRACSNRDTQISMVELLISLGANVNSKNLEGNTPLHEAAACAYIDPEIINILFKNNADHNARNREFKTPLQHGLEVLQSYEIHSLENIQMLKEKENGDNTTT